MRACVRACMPLSHLCHNNASVYNKWIRFVCRSIPEAIQSERLHVILLRAKLYDTILYKKCVTYSFSRGVHYTGVGTFKTSAAMASYGRISDANKCIISIQMISWLYTTLLNLCACN